MTSFEKNRRDPIPLSGDVETVLPEYFTQDNAKLISLLSLYETFLDSDTGTHDFHKKIQDVFASRDIPDIDIDLLDEIIGEIGSGLTQASFFEKPRLMARLLGNFYQQKGGKVSAEGFFRGFFGEEADVQYGKRDIFTVGTSRIGFESAKKIQDNNIFQVLSILIKSGISVSDYELLYKRFVHPAGFNFAGEVLLQGNADPGILVTTHNPLDSGDTGVVTFAPLAAAQSLVGTSFGETTGLMDSSGIAPTSIVETTTTLFRIDLNKQQIVLYDDGVATDSDFTANLFVKYYDDVKTLLNPNSFTFDDSANSGRPDFALTVERMDNDVFTRISSDSAI